MSRRVFITVAEVSGDQHAAHLVRSLRELDPTLVIEGHGGPHMLAEGALIHHETTHRAAMTYRAAKRAGEMLRLFRWTKRYFAQNRPDLLVCVDSPAMNFHFAKLAHEHGIPVLYYVAPQLWAWREGRMAKLQKWVDHVACILPFEEEYFRQRGVTATFVGHPLFDQLPPQRGPTPGPRFPHRPPVVGLLPGSRQSEALANFPHLLDVASQIRQEFPETRFLVPTTPATSSVVQEQLRLFSNRHRSADPASDNAFPCEWAEGRFNELVPQCDLCVTVSGTATLHTAGYGIPMIVVYRMSPLLWHLIGRWLVKTRTYSLVNLLADGRQHIVPEYIPWYGSNRPVAEYAIDLLRHPEKLAEQQQKLMDMVQKLDHPGASLNVARLALRVMERDATPQTAPEPAGTLRD